MPLALRTQSRDSCGRREAWHRDPIAAAVAILSRSACENSLLVWRAPIAGTDCMKFADDVDREFGERADANSELLPGWMKQVRIGCASARRCLMCRRLGPGTSSLPKTRLRLTSHASPRACELSHPCPSPNENCSERFFHACNSLKIGKFHIA